MKTLPTQIWMLFVIVQCINGVAWWFRGTKEKPEKRRSYRKLVLGWILLGNIPWLIIGAGALMGRISSFGDLFYPSRGNPFVVAFHISAVVLIGLSGFWILLGRGAQTLIDHPGLLNRPTTTAKELKQMWLGSLAGAMFAEIMMWMQ